MKLLVFFLAGFGLLCMLSAISGIVSISAGTAGTFIGYDSSWLSRAVTVTCGSVLLWLAYGVHRRLKVAWRVGMFAIATSWVLVFAQVFFFIARDAQPYPPYGRFCAVVLIMGGFSFIYFLWARRWYKSRSYFTYPRAG
jgi:hypothetical protein